MPVETHVPICIKALTFDRSLPKRAGDEIVFAILFQPRYLASNSTHDEALHVVRDLGIDDINGIPVRYVSIPVSDEADIERAVLDSEADILYVAPLRAVSLDAITRVSREHDVMTCSGVDGYGEAGLTLTVAARAEKPEIVINYTAMTEEGVDFTAQLLGYARVLNYREAGANATGAGRRAR
ncbi:DUF4154 domain-containing protein [Candidatus Poribacteria bacterium]|nr:DUF4154 domain-containing protein [Candidatus Poribacteria bacterium]MBT5533830.1 DUF4154 domain-containing protein [Candidatus Poribacteria bacterium]MBT5710448.1 DUF4154 domain-containing protein [Candidatus Poribacteria bacterium]MBT7807429.1 DUF4154 domain-containing protein [Candidatus Poribacteria bacterium]